MPLDAPVTTASGFVSLIVSSCHGHCCWVK